MTTTDVFHRAVTAMSSFVDVPLGGEVYRFEAGPYDVRVQLEDGPHSAQGLLSWLGSLSGASAGRCRLYHHHDTAGNTYVCVGGKRDGLRWDLYAVFRGDDAAVLCEHEDDDGPVPVHRLRAVQMRQLARAVSA